VAAWKTYTPDGRVLEVEHANGEWTAVCAGARGAGSTAKEAITAALGSKGATIGNEEHTIEAWVAAHAAQLEAEAG
jgi:hypothetical protein